MGGGGGGGGWLGIPWGLAIPGEGKHPLGIVNRGGPPNWREGGCGQPPVSGGGPL